MARVSCSSVNLTHVLLLSLLLKGGLGSTLVDTPQSTSNKTSSSIDVTSPSMILKLEGATFDVLEKNPALEEIKSADHLSLRLAMIVHRHGDRTPVSFMPSDKLKDEPFWKFHGLGQLTNRGKARMYLLGEMMRKRYNTYLGRRVNKNLRISRSSGVIRCLESAHTFLASFLKLGLPHGADAGQLVWDRPQFNKLASLWQPASVQSMPISVDGMLAEDAPCQAIDKEAADIINVSAEAQRIKDNFKRESKFLQNKMGISTDYFYQWTYAASQIEIESTYFPNKIAPELIATQERIAEASDLAFGAYQSTVRGRRLRGGLLMGDLVENMRQVRREENRRSLPKGVPEPPVIGKKIVHYSAHDTTLVILLGMLDQWRLFPRAPNYGASLIIELHEIDMEWFVRFFYMPEVPGKLHELHLASCEARHPLSRCTLNRFESLMRIYEIESWQKWMSECGNNIVKLSPYEQAI